MRMGWLWGAGALGAASEVLGLWAEGMEHHGGWLILQVAIGREVLMALTGWQAGA